MALAYRDWLPFAFVLAIACTMVTLNGPIISAGTLNLVCRELGLEPTCNSSEAMKLVAEWNQTVSIISGCFMIFSVGIHSALVKIVGRPKVIAIGLFGIATLELTWGFIYCFSSHTFVQDWWRFLAGFAIAFNCCTGTMAVLLGLGVMGAANDLTHGKNKASRGFVFGILEAIIGVVPIGSMRLSAYLVKHVQFHTTLFVSVGILYSTALLALLFLRNTISEKEKNTEIRWREATIFTAISNCFPTRANIQRLRGPSTDPNDEADDPNEDKPEEDPENPQTPIPDSLTAPLIHTSKDSSGNNSEADIYSSGEGRGGSINQDQEQVHGNLNDLTLEAKPPKPTNTLTSPYFLPIIGIAFFTATFVLYGRRTIIFLYFKSEYKISNSSYANLMTFDALGNGIAIIILFPLLKKLFAKVHNRFGVEVVAASVGLVMQGLAYLSIAYLPAWIGAGGGSENKLWASQISLMVVGLVSGVAPAYTRSTFCLSSLKRSQQHRLIACLTAIEGLCVITSGLVANRVFTAFSWTGSVFVLFCIVLCSGFILLSGMALVWKFVDQSSWDLDESILDQNVPVKQPSLPPVFEEPPVQ